MTTQTLVVGSASNFTITLNGLANATYVESSAIDLSGVDPYDVVVEVTIDPGTTTGNKQAKIFVKFSFDGGTTYSSGPSSGTTTTDEPNLHMLGVLPLNTAAVVQTGQWPLMGTRQMVPTHVKLVVFNDSGVAFDSTPGCSARLFTVTGNSA